MGDAMMTAEERMRHASFDLDDYPEGCESEAVGLLAAIEIAESHAAAAVEAVRKERDGAIAALQRTSQHAAETSRGVLTDLAAERAKVERLRKALCLVDAEIRGSRYGGTAGYRHACQLIEKFLAETDPKKPQENP